MATNTNIKLTADVKAFRQAFGDAADTVKDFTSGFDRRASEIQRIGGRIAQANESLKLSTNTSRFASGITNTFQNLNKELSVATGREQLFGASLDTTRQKSAAYNSALNSLLASGMKPTSDEARRLTAEITRLNAEIDKFKPQKVQRPAAAGPSIGSNLGSVLAGSIGGGTLGAIGGAFGAGGAAVGIALDKMVQLGGAVSRTTDEYNKYRIVLQNVIGDQRTAANAFDFAVAKANEAGLEITSVQDAYKGFVAAGRQSGLSLTELNKIFQGTTRYGGMMAVSNEQISGSLLALSQMLSKSTVSAEELRGQLSERMPGAYSLFAKAMGVSEAQLGKMLEKGQVLAREALPKFAAELEKASAGKYSKNLETMAGSAQLLENKFNLLLDAFGRSSEINTFFASINNGLSSVIGNLTALVESGQWGQFFLALSGNQGAMTYGATLQSVNTRTTGFSKMDEAGRSDKIFKQIEHVQKLEAQLNRLSETYAKTGKNEKEYFLATNALKRGRDTLDYLQKLDAQLLKAGQGAKITPAGVDPKANDNLVKSLIEQSNRRIEEGLRTVRNNALDRRIADTISKQSSVSPVAAKMYIAPTFDLSKSKEQVKTNLDAQLAKYFGQGVQTPVSVAPTGFVSNTDTAEAQIESYFTSLGGSFQSNASEFSSLVASSLGNALSAGFQGMGAAIVQGGNPFKAFGEGLLGSFGDMLIQVGQKMLVEAGAMLAAAVLTGGAVAPFAYRTLALGGALTLTGGAIKAVKLASGGFLNKPTFAQMGEYGNARTNPEIAAPLDRLTGIMRQALLPDIKAATFEGRATQPIYITTINTVDGREVSRSTERYNARRGYINP